jgi:hypothetical protein
VNNDDTDVISAATALVEASNSKNAEIDNRTINVIDNNCKKNSKKYDGQITKYKFIHRIKISYKIYIEIIREFGI